MKERILNIFKSRLIAEVEFNIARRLHSNAIANYTNLAIEDDDTVIIFGYYTDPSSFCQKYVHGMVYKDFNDFANLPYDVWMTLKSRVC